MATTFVPTEAEGHPSNEGFESASPRNVYDLHVLTEQDPAGRELIEAQIWPLHAETYVRDGILDESAIDDGVVTGRIDHSRGTGVEYFLASDKPTGAPLASLRKIHSLGGVADLPSFERCSDGMSRRVVDDMITIESAEIGGTRFVEIAALCKSKDASPEAVLEIYRKAIHDSIRSGETWFMGIVPKTLNKLRSTFGDQVIEVVGVGQHLPIDGVNEDQTLTPVVVQPDRLLDNCLNQYLDSEDDAVRYQALDHLVFFADGLSPNERSDRVNFALSCIFSGCDPAGEMKAQFSYIRE